MDNKTVAFLKTHYNLTFTVLGVLIFIALVSSLMFGISFILGAVTQAFESEAVAPPEVVRFNLAEFMQLGLPVR
jgi:cell shape-determining protein MreC